MVHPGITMQSDGASGLGELEAQLASKEREWKQLLAARDHQLETSLIKAQQESSSLRERYQQLREDFQFNLAIVDERDQELKRYDVLTARALTAGLDRQRELDRLRLQVSELQQQRARGVEERQEQLTASHLLLDQLKSSMAKEIQKLTEEYERMKGDLQCRIQELERELNLQRQEMTAASDRERRERQHEFNLKMDEMRAVVLSCELKVKLLSKENEVHLQARHQTTDARTASQEFCQQIQTQLLRQEQDFQDLTAVKDHKIKELEDELKWMETTLKKEEEDHIKKYEEAVRALKERDTQLEARSRAHAQRLESAEKHSVKMQEEAEVLAAQLHATLREQQDTMTQRDETIQRLCSEVEATQSGWDKYTSQVTREMVVKDTEIIALHERETKLHTERERSREETERYKQQLSAGLKRERALEQMQVQVEVDWQRRCEDMKAQHYLANEQLIQDLTQARDQAKAELKEKEQDLQDLTVLLRSVKTERDQAVQGLTPKVDSLASEEIYCLQQKNGVLRTVVTQMRKDMEGLIPLLRPPQVQPQASSPPPGAPTAPPIPHTVTTQKATGPPDQSTNISFKGSPADYTLEQVSLLKARCRHLEEQLEGATGRPCTATATDKSAEHLTPLLPEDTHLQKQGHKEGGPCWEKRDDILALAERDDRRREQSALLRRLREENLYLRQRQASGPMAAGLLEEGARGDPPLLRSRLKRAASCIARLSREKQQLIEMGNRLRAQTTAAGPQEPVEPERESSTEELGEQQDRLLALEQLQYQLTSQELQFALRQTAGPPAECLRPVTSNPGPATGGAGDPWSQGQDAQDRPEKKENTPSQSQSSVDVGLSRSRLSSETSLRSLKELWEILDRGLSPSMFSEGEGELSRKEVAESGNAGVQMMAYGSRAPIHGQSPATVQQRGRPSKTSSNTTKTSRLGSTGRTCKIRNYNVKD
ncbi:coiled-coil domain-containing protein 57 isoform X2 [Clinocottus analis]|uniref:coiled-coil domain-containing protein 57 isoform X2 n=1 Tax=Clinocottus analis TaxID=304258 RepID=UPI0035BECB59